MKKYYYYLICVVLLFSFLTSCSVVSEEDLSLINEAVNKANDLTIYKASFVLEVKDTSSSDLVMFVQGSYNIDKSKISNETVVLNGELVQTVYNTPSSFRFGFFDDTYVTISDKYKILSDLEEEILLQQFMCAPAVVFSSEEVDSLKKSEVSAGTMFTLNAKNSHKEYFINLLGDDLYSFSGMKMPQKELTEISDITCQYVLSEDNVLKNREYTYNVTAYDSVPYFPGHQATNEDYKRTFSISLKFNYKEFGENVSVDITDFLPDESSK